MSLISTKTHGVLDYLTAGTLLFLPRALGWSEDTTRLLTGAALGTLSYSLLTRYEMGMVRVLPMEAHLMLDGVSVATLMAAAMNIEDREEKQALFALGLFELAVTLSTERDTDIEMGSGPLAPVAEKVGLGEPSTPSIKFARAITIDRPVADLYEQWRNLENLPNFLSHLKSVEYTGDNRTHWVYDPPIGPPLSWDAETISEEPNKHIAWQSVEDSPIQHKGTVTFKEAPGGRGTELHVVMAVDPPGGVLGRAVAPFFEEVTAETLQDDLRGFKQLVETGEKATVDGQPTGPLKGLLP